MKKNKKHRKKIGFSEILILLIFLFGFSVLAYPTFSDFWNKYRNAKLIAEYTNSVNQISHEEYDRIWKEAQNYNKEHTRNIIADAFDEDNHYVLSHPYDTYLNLQNDGVMGYLSIPRLETELTIYHGTGTDTLEKGIGHVEGTSLPVGGSGTHCVIAGHRGLPNARMFTDLDQMEIGDLFYIHVLDQVLAYQVDQIKTVLPEQTDDLAIEPGEDYVTLLTCTPYGVNTHRLLIRGTRVPYSPGEDETGPFIRGVLKDKRVLLLGAGLLMFIIILFGMLRGKKSEKTKGIKRGDD